MGLFRTNDQLTSNKYDSTKDQRSARTSWTKLASLSIAVVGPSLSNGTIDDSRLFGLERMENKLQRLDITENQTTSSLVQLNLSVLLSLVTTIVNWEKLTKKKLDENNNWTMKIKYATSASLTRNQLWHYSETYLLCGEDRIRSVNDTYVVWLPWTVR